MVCVCVWGGGGGGGGGSPMQGIEVAPRAVHGGAL